MKKFTLVDYTMNADRIEEPELEDIDSEIDFIIAQISSNNTIMNGVGATGTEFVCPIMTESQLSNVANMLLGADSPVKNYRAGKIKLLLGDPRLELCDVIKLDYKDTEYIIPITSISFEYDGGLMTDLEAYALKEPTLLTPSQRLDFAVQEEVKKVIEQLKNIDGTYFYIRYSPNADGSNMTEDSDDKTEYIGVCSTNQASPPDEASAYTWSKFKGKDGLSNFFHVKYSNDGGKTFTDTNGETAGEYIGILVDSNENDSEKPSDYTWSKIVGKDGGTLQVKYKNSATVPTITNNDISGWSDKVPAPEKGKRTYMTQKLSTETNWSTPIQISAEDGTTPTITITSDGYWKIDDDKTTVKAEGTPGKTPTITVGPNGNWFVDDKDTNTKAQGAQGKDGADIEYVYYLSSDGNTPSKPSYSGTTLSNGWTPSPQGISSTNKYEFVSVRTKAAGSTSWSDFSPPVIWSKWGEKGTDGDGVEYKYYLCNDSKKPDYVAGSDEWTDEPTGVSATNMYEYVVQITHYGDGRDDKVSPVSLWAKWGETGDDGRGVSKVVTEYYLSTSETTQIGGSWSEDAPEWVDGKYLWTRLATTYTDGKTEYSDPVVDASWKKTSVVDAASKELNETLANALGLHVTEYKVGTSNIRYYHSNPSLTNSKSGDTILVFNSSGFGVCKTGWNNGNPSFTYGTTFDGKAIWDILTANTINANLINAGSIKSLSTAKVQTEINLNTGEATFNGVDVVLGIKGTETESNGVVFPEGMWLQSKYEDSQWIYTLSHGMRYFTKEYFIALARYQLGLTTIKPTDPYYSEVLEQSIKTSDIHCKNIYLLDTGSATEYNLLDELVMMGGQVNLLSESLAALQQKYLELEAELNKPHVHEQGSAVTENYVDSTCAKAGSYESVVYCTTCGEQISRVSYSIAKKDHSYTSSITKQPTCTATGTRKHTCSVCGNSYTETIAATGHKDTDGNGHCDACGAVTGTFYTIAVTKDPSNGGKVKINGVEKSSDSCLKDSQVTLLAEPAEGYSFDGWYYNGSKWSSNASYSFTVNSTRTLTAKFTKNPTSYTISLTASPTGGGYFKIGGVKTNSSSVTEGSTVTIEAIPNDGFTFKKWNDGSTSASKTITVNGAIAYTATFEAVEKILYEGEETSVDLPVKQERIRFKFTPQYSGSYTFESLNLGNLDPDVYLYASDKTTQLSSKTNTGGFVLTYDSFVAGTTYYVEVKLHEGTGTLKFKVTKDATVTKEYMTAQLSAVNAGIDESYHLARNADGTGIIGDSGNIGSGETVYYFAHTDGNKVVSKVQFNWDGNITENTAEELASAGYLSADYKTFSFPRTVGTIWLGTTYKVTVYFAEDSSGGGTVLNDGDTITEGVETLVNVTQTQKRVFLKFVPNSTKAYTFESLNLADLDPDCQIYASDKSTMLDNKASSGAFSLSYNFTAGTTYWLAVIMYKGTGTLKVKIS